MATFPIKFGQITNLYDELIHVVQLELKLNTIISLNHHRHHHPPPPPTKKSPECEPKLMCYSSNTDRSYRPDRGALRYLGVHSPRGTTLHNMELCSELNMPLKVRTNHTTTATTTTTPNQTKTATTKKVEINSTHHQPVDKPVSFENLNVKHMRKVKRKWNEMLTDQGKFTIVPNIDYGVAKSTNKKKQQENKVKRKEKEIALKLEQRKATDLRKEIENKSEKIKKNFFTKLNMKTSKRKVTDDVPDVEEKRNDKYLKMEDNHEDRKTTDTASSLLKPELQDAPVQAARTFNFNSKLNFIPEGNLAKLRNIFANEKNASSPKLLSTNENLVYVKSKVENLGANPTDGRQEASHDWRRSWQIGKRGQSGDGLENSKNQE